jgi:hypothetical protein
MGFLALVALRLWMAVSCDWLVARICGLTLHHRWTSSATLRNEPESGFDLHLHALQTHF